MVGVQNGQWLIESKVLYFSEVETIIITLCAKFFTAFSASKWQTLKKDHLRQTSARVGSLIVKIVNEICQGNFCSE